MKTRGTTMGTVRNLFPIATLLIVGTLLLASAPASGGAPKPMAWNASSTAPGGLVLDIEGSDSLEFFAVGTGDTFTNTNGQQTPVMGDNDFFAYNFTRGLLHTYVDEPVTTPSIFETPEQRQERLDRRTNEGTPMVAASANGRYLAGAAPFVSSAPNLMVMDTARNVTWTARVPQAITAIAFSADGAFLAVATGSGTTGSARLYGSEGLVLVSTLTTDGPMRSVAISGDAQWVVASGDQVINGVVFGAVHLYERGAGNLLTKVWNTTIRTPNEGVSHVRISRSGDVFVAATQAGTVLAFGNMGPATGAPGRHLLGGKAVTAFELSTNGRVAVVANGSTVTLLNVGAGGSLGSRWTHPVTTNATSAALSADGSYLVVAAGKAYGFHTANATPIWTLPLNNVKSVALSENGTRIVAAVNDRVYAYEATRAFVLSIALTPTSLDSSVTYGGLANTPVRVPLRLFNDGTIAQTFTLAANLSNGLAAEFEHETLTLSPGQTTFTNVTLTPGNVGTGNLTAVINALAPEAETQRVTVVLAMEPTHGFLMEISGATTREVRQGGTDQVRVTLHNFGNVAANVRVEARQTADRGGLWNLTLDGPSDGVTVVPPATSIARTLTVGVPGDAADGTRLTLDITTTVNNVSTTRTVTYNVNPFSAFTFALDGTSRYVDPGRAASYDLRVTNLGSVQANVSIGYVFESVPNGAGWNLNVDEPTFTLAAGASRTVKVTVTVPATAKQGQAVHAVLNLSLLENPGIYQHQELFVTVKNPAPKPPRVSTENETPGFGPVAVLALLALAAVALRRQGVRPQ